MPVMAAMKSFCACTVSAASIMNSGWPLLDAVARPRQQFGDPAGIGRKHRRRAILVDRDLALGDVLGAEGVLVTGSMVRLAHSAGVGV